MGPFRSSSQAATCHTTNLTTQKIEAIQWHALPKDKTSELASFSSHYVQTISSPFNVQSQTGKSSSLVIAFTQRQFYRWEQKPHGWEGIVTTHKLMNAEVVTVNYYSKFESHYDESYLLCLNHQSANAT